MVSALRMAALAVVFASSVSASYAEERVFAEPVYKSHALDWCLNWGVDCGKPAADKYCQLSGYEYSSSHVIWEDLGKSTRVIGSGQVCDDGYCDSFKKITCYKQDVAETYDDENEKDLVTYNKPKVGSRRLDWCLTWAKGCGKPAADYYCQKQGHTQASAFKIASNIGKTHIYQTGENCTQPDCDGFRFITCE